MRLGATCFGRSLNLERLNVFWNGCPQGVWEAYNPGLHRRSLELDRLTPG